MSVNDPIADMLTRIRNGIAARQQSVAIPSSKMKQAICKILKGEGYIRDYDVVVEGPRRTLKVLIRYYGKWEPAISGLQRISKSGRRAYSGTRALPRVAGGVGISIVSTSKGIMTARDAHRQAIGGEILCRIW